MDIPGRMRLLVDEYGPDEHGRREALRAALLHHLREVDHAAREDCRRITETRRQIATACGAAAVAAALDDVAQLIAEGGTGP